MRLGLAILTALALSACSYDAMSTKPEVKGLEGAAALQTLYHPVSPAELTLRPGGQFKLVLKSNPTTGYFWQVLEGLESGVITQVDNSYESDPHPEGMVGVGGNETFLFEAAQPGKTRLKLGYARSGQAPVETLVVKLTVKK